MKFGINILNFGSGTNPMSLLARAQTAESLGFQSVLISDHIAITPDVRPRYSEPYYDTFATLSWIAGQTATIQLGTTVCVLPYRHPVLTARLAANIDQFSGGRFIFGVGIGGNRLEFDVLGMDVTKRGAVSNEYLEIIYALWTEEEVTYHGRFVTIDDVSGIQPHVSGERTHPPVWVGGRSDAAMRRAIRFDAAWHPNGMTQAWLRDSGMPRMSELAAELDRPVPALCPRIRVQIMAKPVADEGRIFGVGTIDQLHEDLKLLDELGAEHVLLDWYVAGDPTTISDDDKNWRAVKLLTEQVIDVGNERVR